MKITAEDARFIIDVSNLAGRLGLDVGPEFAETEDVGRLVITDPDEDQDRLVAFVNLGPATWDYELTTSDFTGVPVLFVGNNGA